jgi:TetR/AcrR family transcriptional regulator, regulator of autoinduction and epiphytic fitness
MSRPVKPSSPPSRRERKAQQTRRRVLAAAEVLFVHHGYAATTIAAIAEAADVAVQTVYAVFGTKRALLAELLEIRTVGDDESMPLRDRADWQAMENQPDPRRQLQLLTAIATRIGERIGALSDVMAAAASSDPEVAALWRQRQAARYNDQRRIARRLARTGALRTGLSEAHATDTITTLANPHTYHALVNQRRWSIEEYESWLAHLLRCALLESDE